MAFPARTEERRETALHRSPVWREKLAAQQALRTVAQETKTAFSSNSPAFQQAQKAVASVAPPQPGWAWLTNWLTQYGWPYGWVACAAGLALIGLGWWLFSTRGKEDAPPIAKTETPVTGGPSVTVSPAPLLKPAASPAVTSPKQKVATFALALDLSRQTADVATLALKPGTALIELQLDLGAAAGQTAVSSYRVALYTAADALIWQAAQASPHPQQGRRVLLLKLPAHLLAPGSYELRLRAGQAGTQDATLPFKVIIP